MAEYGSGWHGEKRGGGWRRGQGRKYGGQSRHHSWSQEQQQDYADDEQQHGAYGSGYRGRYGRGSRKRGYDRENTGDGTRGGSERPPPGLRGRDIGMWYAARSKHKQKNREDKNSVLKLDSEKEKNLSDLLANIRSSDKCPPQPSRRFQDPYLDDQPCSSKTYADPFENEEYNYKKNQKAVHKTEAWHDDQELSTLGKKSSTQSEAYGHKNHRYSGFKNENRYHTEEDRKYPGPSVRSESLFAATSSSISKVKKENCLSDDLQFLDSDSDSDLDDSNLLQLTQEMEKNFQDGVINNSSGTSTTDSADYMPLEQENSQEDMPVFDMGLHKNDEQEESGFLFEFRKHNEANRQSSMENLTDLYEPTIGLQRDPNRDQQLQQELHKKKQNDKYRKMMEFRKKLPSFNMREEVVSLINSNQVVVLSGETGCGKTTQVTQFLLDDHIERGDGSLCRIVCTQPRRISAISVAERVADERAESCGESSVGYQIRLDAKKPKDQGSILYCTTGILLKWLHSDRLLSKTSHVILDEVHERDLQTDFLMIIVRDLLSKRRDLKLVIMSATLNAEQFSQYFYGCPMLNIPGFTYPVEEFLLEDVLELTGYKMQPARVQKRRFYGRKRDDDQLPQFRHWCNTLRRKYSQKTCDSMQSIEDFEKIDIDLCAHLTEYIARNKKEGAILVFLPGWGEIKSMNDALESRPFFRNKSFFKIIPLHSLMPTVNQRQVFERPPPGVRKIIIATNIAETSITIDDVVYVIDCGKIKMKNYNPADNIQTLKPEWVSKANAKQRRGRAGRVQPGECYHLYSQFHEQQLEDYQLPEMLRTRLEELCLHIKLLKLGFVEPFVQKAMQMPSLESLKQSLQILRDLNALDENEDLTPLGYHLAKMPVDPHSGKMLLFAALFSCLDPIMTVAASLSFKDAFYVPLGQEKVADARKVELAGNSQSDHIMLANAFQGWEKAKSRGSAWQYCRNNFLSQSTLQMLSDMRRQFATLLYEMNFLETANPKCPSANKNSGNVRLLKAIICAGLFPNVAQLVSVNENPGSNKPHRLRTKTDRRVVFHPKSVNSKENHFSSQWVIYHLKLKVNAVCLFDSTVVSPLSLLFFGGDMTVGKEQTTENHTHRVHIGGHVTLSTNKKTCALVKELRTELDRLLEYKITHPGAIDWNPKTKEGALIQAIVDLVKTEVETPPDFGRKGKRDRNMTCHMCGESGHYEKKCPY